MNERLLELPRNQIIVGDARQQLSLLPSGSVDMVLTSPPYFRLRDYGVAGQLGLEAHVDQWVGQLQAVTSEIRRLLVPSGSFWLNVSDTYASHANQGAAPKSLLLGPERLALALVADGWLLRNKIVWQKPNPTPSSVRDRLNCSWEALYVFVRSPRYYFNLDAIRVAHTSQRPTSTPANVRPRQRQREAWRGPNGDDTSGLAQLHAQGRVGHPLGKNPGDVWRIASSGYRGAHHATFPVALAERAIRAGCPELRCRQCRTPWRRPIIRSDESANRGDLQPGCSCQTSTEPGLVLDPFFGAGTTAIAADQLHRDWLGIELNPSFADLAGHRIAGQQPIPAAHAPP